MPSPVTRLTVILAFFLLLTAAYPVIAQDSATSSSIRKQLLQRNAARQEKAENAVSTLKEKEASRVAKLKLKLQTFKNKTKVSAAEKINANLNLVNQKQTAQLQKFLTTMTSILDKLETRGGRALAIADARGTIASASAAVVTQAQKDYTIEVTTESKLKADAKNQRDKLHTDLQTVRKLVIDAKQGVANAIRAAKSGKEATSSGQQ